MKTVVSPILRAALIDAEPYINVADLLALIDDAVALAPGAPNLLLDIRERLAALNDAVSTGA